MPDGLYDRDIVAWADQQADTLERLARGERVNDAVDWENVIDEVRDVGQTQLRQCEGLLIQALVHLIKLRMWPEHRAARHWRVEADTFLVDAALVFTNAMHQKLDLERAFRIAVRRAEKTGPRPLSAGAVVMNRFKACPFTIDDLAGKTEPDVEALLARFRD